MRVASRRRQRGVTLVELMVGLVLGLLLIAGVVQIFSSSRVSYTAQEEAARLQENGRFALYFIEQAARQAGRDGCWLEGQLESILNPTAGGTPFALDFETAIEGYEATGTAPDAQLTLPASGGWTPSLPAAVSGLTPPPVVGSDVLVVRGLSMGDAPLVDPFQESAGLFAGVGAPFEDGDILVVTDCNSASMFQVSNVQEQPNQGRSRVVHSAAAGTPGNSTPQLQNAFGADAFLARMTTTVFYVGLDPASREPALYRAELTGGTLQPQVLIDGVENMQVLYGEDRTGAGTAGWRVVDDYVTAPAVLDWDAVMSVRVALLMRGEAPVRSRTDAAPVYGLLGTQVTPPEDRRLRRVFTTTVSLRNRAL